MCICTCTNVNTCEYTPTRACIRPTLACIRVKETCSLVFGCLVCSVQGASCLHASGFSKCFIRGDAEVQGIALINARLLLP